MGRKEMLIELTARDLRNKVSQVSQAKQHEKHVVHLDIMLAISSSAHNRLLTALLDERWIGAAKCTESCAYNGVQSHQRSIWSQHCCAPEHHERSIIYSSMSTVKTLFFG